jgi:sugar phosphate isomerase/epimerase
VVPTASAAARNRLFEIGISLSPRAIGPAPWLFSGDLQAGLDAAASSGFDTVELSLRSANDVDVASLRTQLDRAGLRVSGITTAQAKIVDGLVLSADDAELYQAALGRLLEAVKLAAELDADLIIGGMRGRLSGDGDAQARQRERVVEAVRDCARHADSLGVRILLEPLNRYETNLVNTVAEGVTFLAEVGEPSTRLLLDTFHMNIEEARIEDSLRAAGPLLGYLHVADSNRRAPGLGHIDFDTIVAVLAEVGFGGPVVAEILPVPDDAEATRLTARFWGRS